MVEYTTPTLGLDVVEDVGEEEEEGSAVGWKSRESGYVSDDFKSCRTKPRPGM
jgi:hypothetical protein